MRFPKDARRHPKKTPLMVQRCFFTTQVYKPGSVLTAIYLAPQLLTGSSHLLGTAGLAYCPTHGVAPDRVYIVKPMFPWAGCALTAPFHPYFAPDWGSEAVSLCCTCPGVTPGGRYPLSLPYGARTFLIWVLSDPIRGCPTWLRCLLYSKEAQLSNILQNLFERDILKKIE